MELWPSIAATTTAGLLTYGVLRDRRRKRADTSDAFEDMILVARSNHKYDSSEAVMWLDRLMQFRRPEKERYTKGQVRFVFRMEKDKDGEVRFYFRAPDDRRIGVQQVLPPTLEWHKIERPSARGSNHPVMWLRLDDPLLTLQKVGKRDHLLTLLRSLGPQMAIEISFSPADTKQYYKLLRKRHAVYEPSTAGKRSGGAGGEIAYVMAESAGQIGAALVGKEVRGKGGASQKTQKKELLPHQAGEFQALKDRYMDLPQMMEVTMKIEILRPEKNPNAYFQSVLGAMMNVAEHNRLVQARRPNSFLLSCEELAQFVHLPSADEWPNMPIIREHARTLEKHEFAEGVAVGYLQNPIQKERIVAIPDEQFQTHVLLSGKTGAGKSSTLVFLMQSIIDRWATSTSKKPQPGFTLFDPAEETALIVLSRLQAALPADSPLWEKVHYLSFSNTEYPVGLNVMQTIGADGLLSLLQGNYGGGAQMDRLIRNAIETLQGDTSKKHIVAGISPLLWDSNWRNRVLPSIKDQFLRFFWERDFAALERNPNAFQPVENRLSPFISGTQRLYFGQPEYALPLRKWMDEGHIFLVDVKALGKELMYLIVGSMIEHYHWTAQGRPQSTSLPHYLLIDECHRVQTPTLPSIVKEDRKFGLSLGLITQSVEQFNQELKREIKDNLGNIIALRQGIEGSKTIAELSNGHFDTATLRAFDNFVSAVYTVKDGKAQSIETKALPPTLFTGFKGTAEPVDFKDKRATAARYDELRQFAFDLQKKIGRPRQVVQDEMNFYLRKGYWPKKGEVCEISAAYQGDDLEVDGPDDILLWEDE